MSDDQSNQESVEKRKALENAIALGYREAPIKYQDGSDGIVKVRFIKSVKAIPDFWKKVDGEEVDFCNWITGSQDAENWDVDSIMDVIEVAMELNFQRASRWAESRGKRTKGIIDAMTPEQRVVTLKALVAKARSEGLAPEWESSSKAENPRRK